MSATWRPGSRPLRLAEVFGALLDSGHRNGSDDVDAVEMTALAETRMPTCFVASLVLTRRECFFETLLSDIVGVV